MFFREGVSLASLCKAEEEVEEETDEEAEEDAEEKADEETDEEVEFEDAEDVTVEEEHKEEEEVVTCTYIKILIDAWKLVSE